MLGRPASQTLMQFASAGFRYGVTLTACHSAETYSNQHLTACRYDSALERDCNNCIALPSELKWGYFLLEPSSKCKLPSMTGVSFANLSFELLYQILRSCDSFSDLTSLAASCKGLYNVWSVRSGELIWAVGVRDVLAFDNCLMAVSSLLR